MTIASRPGGIGVGGVGVGGEIGAIGEDVVIIGITEMMTIAAIAVAMKGEATVVRLKAEDGDGRCC